MVRCLSSDLVPSPSSDRITTTPRDFAAQVTLNTTVLALCGDAGGPTSGAGALLARLLAAVPPQVPVATALRLAEPRPARRSAGRRLVLELGAMSGAVEGALQGLAPAMLLLLNVPPADVASCSRLAAQLLPGGALLACGDDAGAMAVVDALRAHAGAGAAPRALITYGIGEDNDWRACNLTRQGAALSFDITLRRGGRVSSARVTLPVDPALDADHQVTAALGALLATCMLDVGASHAAEGGHMDCVASAVDIPQLMASAGKAAAALNEP